ncbi:hypothetical protein Trydic_g9082 [Trypoxylus dichotomus]
MGERIPERLWNISENRQIGDGNDDLTLAEKQRRLALRRKMILKRNNELIQQRAQYDRDRQSGFASQEEAWAQLLLP